MAYDPKEAYVWPVNANGEIIVQSGVGTSDIAGFMPSNMIPIDPDTSRVVIKLPSDIPVANLSPDGAVQSLVGLGGGGSRFTNTILRSEALSRFYGVCGTGGVLQTTGQSGTAWTMVVKMEMEGHFNAVRLFRVNRSGTTALNGDKALVGVTESNDFTAANGLTVAQNLSMPVYSVAGTATAYNQLAPAGTVNGFQAVTWPGIELVSLTNATTTATATTKRPHGLVTGNTVTMRDNDIAVYNVTDAAITVLTPTTFTFTLASDPAASVGVLGVFTSNACGTPRPTSILAQTYSISNRIPLLSRPTRLDGGTRPLLLYRYWHDGVAQAFPFNNLSTATRTPSTETRGRTIQVGATLADAVGNLGWNPTADTVLMDVFPIVSYSVPVLSVWGSGDSTMQNDGLVADKISSWLYRACASVSTLARPVVYSNFAASSQNSATYWANTKAALAAGAPPPSILFVGMDSVNDGVNTASTVQSTYAFAQDVISTASKYGIPILVFVPRMPLNSLSTAQYALKLSQDAGIATLATSYGVRVLPITGLGDGANPERWIPALNNAGDGIHPTPAAIEQIAAQAASFLASVLAQT